MANKIEKNIRKQNVEACSVCKWHWFDIDGECRCEINGFELNNPIVGPTDICDCYEKE